MQIEAFFNEFIKVLEDEYKKPLFIKRFNDKKERTKLMLSSSSIRDCWEDNNRRSEEKCKELKQCSIKCGIVSVAGRRFLGNANFFQPSLTRYLDFVVFEGEWWQGKQICSLVVEVENYLNEFEGTMCDLLRCQAPQKIGIFYYQDKPDEKEYNCKINEVFRYFGHRGIIENAGTEYLIIIGPNQITDKGLGTWFCISVTSEKARNGLIPPWIRHP